MMTPRWRYTTAGWLSVAFCWLAVACHSGPTPEQCELLLDRYTELLVKQENPKVGDPELRTRKEAARSLAATDPSFEFSSCQRRVSRRQYECAMAAPTVDTVERCLL